MRDLMRIMPKLLVLLAALLLGAAVPARAHAAAADSDPKAVAIAEQVLKSLGGREKWASLTGLRWTFGAAVHDTLKAPRHHSWNLHTGQHRVEGVTRSGVKFLFIHTIGDSTSGIAFMNDTRIEGDSLRKLTDRAQALWTNDSYWFLMPYKMLDPGVHLKYDGEVKDSLGTFDRVAMSFDQVGLTPGDRYWVYVNQKNHRVERWEYVLQGTTPPPVQWTWEGWEQHDGLWFPTAHRQGITAIMTNGVATVSSFPASEFQAP
jgi:hypothetical protein